MVGDGLRYKNSRDLDRKIWQSAHLWPVADKRALCYVNHLWQNDKQWISCNIFRLSESRKNHSVLF